jgi:integrase
VIENDGIKLIFDQLKQDRGVRPIQRRALIPFIPNHPNVCPATAIEEYLQRTNIWRNNNKQKLFLSIRGQHGPLSSQRIAKYLLQSMKDAGIDIDKFKAHSIRGASATKLLDKGVSAEDVMRAGRWSSYSVFNRFYDRASRTVNVINTIR